MENGNDESKYSVKRYKGIIIAATIAICIFYLLFKMDDVVTVINRYLGYISPVIYGIFIAYIMNPVAVFFERLLRKRFLASKKEKTRAGAAKNARNLSIAIAMILGITVVVVLCLMIIPSLLESVIDLANKLVPLLNTIVDKIDSFTSNEGQLGDSIQAIIEGITDSLKRWITSNLLPTAQSTLTYITSSVASVISFIYNFFVGIIVAIYALCERRSFVATSKKLTYVLFSPRRANRIIDTARHGHDIFGGFLTGKLIDSLIVGIICFIFCLCAGMPYPLLVSSIIGITNIVPFFGPFIGGIPCTFVILMVNPIKGIIFGVFIVILQQIDGNIIGAKILGNATGVSEFWVTFALLLFGGMFGFVGMMIGVPLISIISYVLTVLVNDRAERRNLATDDAFYYNVDRYDESTGEFVPKSDSEKKRRLRKNPEKPTYAERIKSMLRKNKNK